MRVLLVNDLPPGQGGGAEVVLSRQAEALAAAGHDVDLWAGHVVHTGARRVLDIWDPVARRQLAGHAARFRPDVVHHHNVLRELSVSVLGVPPGTPQVLTAHDARLLGVLDEQWRDPRALVARFVKDPLDRATVRRRVDSVVAVSRVLAARYEAAGFPGVRHVPVPGPAGSPPAGAPPSASQTVLFVGRLAADKGAAVLAEAFERVATDRSSARLVVAGTGPEEPRLRALAEATGRVELLGRVPPEQVPALLVTARVVVVPSLPALRPEGAPLVAVEAAWAGRPLVVSDDPGLAELASTLSGTQVTPAGDVAAVAAALARLLDDAAEADARGAANAQAASAYSPAAGADALTALYEELLQR